MRLYAPSLTPQLHPYPSSTMTSNSSQVDMDRDVGVEEEGVVGDLLRREGEREAHRQSTQGPMDTDRDVGVEGTPVGQLLVREQEREREALGQEVQGEVGLDRDVGLAGAPLGQLLHGLKEGQGVDVHGLCGAGAPGDQRGQGAGVGEAAGEAEVLQAGRQPQQRQRQQQGADGGEGQERAGREQGGVGAVPPGSVYPGVAALPFYDVVLRPGHMLYIPPGWWHFVRSLSVSFTVSLWWG